MPSDRKDVGVLVTALVAALAFVVGSPRASTPRRPAADKPDEPPREAAVAAEGAGAETPEHRALAPLRESRDASRFGAAGPPPDLGTLGVEFQIATVPDPLDSRFGYRFDSTVTAIQVAVESQGYTLDRFYLPWRPRGDQPGTKDELKPTPAATPRREVELSAVLDPGPAAGPRGMHLRAVPSGKPGGGGGESPSRHEVEPGALVFRRVSVDEPGRYYVVFLVGESPISGIHKPAMATALDIVGRYRREALLRGRDAEPIRVVGPYFTGGAASLARAMSAWAEARWQDFESIPWAPPGLVPPAIEVRTGSANAIDPDAFVTACRPAEARFAATVAPYSVLMSSLLEYFRALNLGRRLPKLAILSESSTSFGQSASGDGAAGPIVGRAREVDLKQFAEDPLVIKYPFHISQVALEYNSQKGDGNGAQPRLARSSSRLSVPFDELGTPRDSVPALSPRMAAARDEFALANILSTLAREDYHYIGIVATDARDVIFLVGLIREFCPDVQVFGLEADLILAHPDYLSDLRGMILASPYPLHGATQDWTPASSGQGRRHHFTAAHDQGCYNAVLTHFADAHPTARASEAPMRWAYDYGPIVAGPTPGVRPPVWITQVGQQGLWPLASRVPPPGDPARDAYNRYVYAARSWAEPPAATPSFHAPWGWLSTYFGLAAMILALCGLSDRAMSGPPSIRRWLFLYRFWPMGRAQTREAQDFYIRSCLWGLGLIFIPISAAALLWPAGLAAGSPYALPIYVAYALMALLATAGPPFEDYRRRRPGPLGPLLRTRGRPGPEPPPMAWRERVRWMFQANALLATIGLVAILIRGRGRQIDLWLNLVALQVHVIVLASIAHTALARGGLTGPRRGGRRWTGAAARVAFGLASLAAFEVATLAWVVTWGGWWVPRGFEAGADRLFLDRVKTLSDGVSPVLPLVLLSIALVLSLLNRLRALYIYDRVLYDRARDPEPMGRRRPSLFFLVDLLVDAYDLAEKRLRAVQRLRARRRRADDARRGVVRTDLAPPPSPAAPTPPRRARRAPPLDMGEIDYWTGRIDLLLVDLTRVLRGNPLFLMAVGLMTFAMFRLVARVVPSPDGPIFTYAFIALLCGSAFAVMTAFARFFLLWARLRDLLRALALMPMQAAYDRLPAVVGQSYGRYLDRYRTRLSSLRLHVQAAVAVARCDPAAARAALAGLPRARQAPDVALAENFEAELRASDLGPVAESPTRLALRRLAHACLERLRRDHWPRLDVLSAFGTAQEIAARAEEAAKRAGPQGGAAAPGAGAAGPPPDEFRDRAEELLALEFLGIASQYAAQFRSLATYLTISPLLLIWAVESYPFVPQRYPLVFLWTAWATIIVGMVHVYIQLDRNEFLSHVSRTRPNRVTLDGTFLSSMASLLIPILGVVVAQFPVVSDALNQWFGPILRVLR